jgi:hypothetical protein
VSASIPAPASSPPARPVLGHRALRVALAGAGVVLFSAVVGACQPTPYSGRPTGPKIGVIGDSLIVQVQKQATDALVTRGWTASVTGGGGAATADEFDTMSQLMSTGPQVVVLALGTNDIRKINDGQQTWDGLRADVRNALNITRAASCVAWVGVSDYNGYWGPGVGDMSQSGRVANLIIQEELAASGRPAGTTFYGDWAAISRRMDFYYEPGDVHHSQLGMNAYTGLILSTADQCPGAPIRGSLDRATGGYGQITVAGWASDPDAGTDPIAVHVYVNGVLSGATIAGGYRPDVAAAFPGIGPNHGFGMNVPAPAGADRVCVYAINVGPPGDNPAFGCAQVQVRDMSPFGSLDWAVGGYGQVAVAGWAVDPSAPAEAIGVHVYVDGVLSGAATTEVLRPDVAAAFAGAGSNQGFGVTVVAPAGSRQVCVYAINVGAGANSFLGCGQVRVRDASPFGSLDWAVGGYGQVAVAGWAVDPSAPAEPIAVHVYVDGVLSGAATTEVLRPDVAAAFAGAGSNQGFGVTVVAPAGSRQVCVYAINVGAGANSLLGCRTVSVGVASPTVATDEKSMIY